ncbi:MAG: hypothetical protein DHS80DRAFT_115, partial [Piptocephalis tieghemiana]
RPPNAFILYRRDRQAQLRLLNPGIANQEVSCLLGTAWGKEDEAVKERYRKLANELKVANARVYDGLEFRPR